MDEHDKNSGAALDEPVDDRAPTDLTAWDLSVVPARPGRVRLWSGVVLAACGGVLVAAAWIQPSPDGVGVQSQLGLGTCGMLKMTGLPCPTCGMTTAFAHTVRGNFVGAFWAQPGGLVLAIATAIVGVGGAWSLALGRLPPVQIPVLTPFRLLFGMLLLLVGGWAFKIITMMAERP